MREEIARMNGVLDAERQFFEKSLADRQELIRQHENEIGVLNTVLAQKTAESAEQQKILADQEEQIAGLQRICAAEKAEKEALQKRNTHLLLRCALRMDDWCSAVKRFIGSPQKNDSGEIKE